MGVSRAGQEMEQRNPEMMAFDPGAGRGAEGAARHERKPARATFPEEMTTGLNLKEFGEIILAHRESLYPEAVTIDLDSAKRVRRSLMVGGLVKPDASISGLHDTSIAGG